MGSLYLVIGCVALAVLILVLVRLYQRMSDKNAKLQMENESLKASKKVLEEKCIDLNIELRHMEEVTHHDVMTGLLNKRAFNEEIEMLLSNMARNDGLPENRRPKSLLGRLGLILIDVDHFKRINDSFHHQVGDTILVRVAQEIKSHCRQGDLCYRWGGEEFAVICPNIDSEDLHIVAEKIRRAVEGSTFIEKRGRVTVSIGLSFTEVAVSAQELFESADRALYEAKKTGRNKVCDSH